MKHIIVKTHTADKTIGEVRVITKDGQPTVIKADRNVNYEFFHEEINAAPNHIITKRVGDDLHVSFEREGAEVDLIIEGFYEYEHNALIGIAENGSYYYYIPDTGEVEDYVTKLKAGEVEGQALGGENVIAPLWLPVPNGFAFPWWALIPLVPLLFIDKDGDPEPTSPVSTNADEKAGTFNELTKSNNPVTQNIMGNDKGIDVNSLRLIDPVSGTHTYKVIVPGQGVWELKAGTDEVTFTPEKGFLANPTPINYYAVGTNGSSIESTPVSVQYPSKTTADRSIGETGKPKSVHVVSNDDNTIDPTTVRLVDPNSPTDSPIYTDKLVVPGEGTWTVDKDANGVPTGYVTFTPEKGFTGDPTPIHYVVNTKPNSDGTTEQLLPTPVSIEYPTHPVADFKVGSKGQPVIQNVTQNDGNQGKDVDPTSVQLIDPKNPNTPTDKVVVAGQGVWTLKVGTDEVTFTPEAGFTGTPTPIFYIVNDTTGVTLPKTTVGVAYPDVLDTTPKPDFKTGVPGQPVTQKVISNDGNGGDNIDPTSVQLIDPKTGTPSTSVTVPNEGVWTTTPTGDVTFTPNKGFNGDPTPISYTVKDKDGNTLPTTTVDVGYPSTQLTPMPTPDSKTGVPGQPVTQNVTSNDGDNGKDVDPSSVKLIDPKTGTPGTSVTVPNEGVWTTTPTGDVTFTPNKDFTGDPTPITYTVTDKNGNTLPTTPVDVNYPKEVPTPMPTPDSKTGVPGQPVTQNVISNDGDNGKDIDPTSVKLIDPKTGTPSTSVTVPNEGVWTTTPTGDVTFTPNKDFTGDPTPITYTVTDKNGNTLPQTPVDVNYPTSTPTPTPTPDSKTGVPGQPVTQNVTSNDGDNGKDIDPSSVKLIDPKTGTPGTSVTVPNEGVWTTTPTGDVTFTPNKDFTGDPTPITYTVTDKDGNTLPKTPVDVNYPTSKPTPTPTPDSKTGVPGQPVTQNVTSNDGDNGKDVDPTSVKLIDPKTGTPGTSVTVPNEGVWTTTPTGDVTFTPNKDFTGDPTPITYTVTDKNGNTLPQTPVDVNYPTTVPTPIPTPDSKTGVPGQPVTQNVTSNDGDNGKDIDPSSVKLVDPKTGTPGTSVTVPNEGVWTTTPTGDVTFTPNKDFTGDPTPITYTVTDKNGNTLPPTTVDVAYPEKQPTPLPTPDVKEGVPGQPVTQNVTSNDGDNGKDIDPTSVKLIDPITGTPSTSVTVPNEGTWTTTPTGDVTFTPNKDFTGDPTPIPYTVTDKNGNTLPTSTVDVNYPNTSTVSTLPDSKPGERGTPVSQNVLENDGNNIDPTTVQLINPNNPAAGGTDTVVIPNEGTWTVDKDPTTGKPNGSITFTPNPGFEDDPAPINYIAKNPEGVTSKQTPVNVVYPKTPEVIVPDNPPTPANPTGMGDNEVFEGNTAGVQGMFKVVPGLSSATIKEILLANESGTTVMVPLTVSPSAPVTLNTAKGVLTITSYDSTTGDVSYVFVPKVQNHATDAPVLDQISIVVKDSNDRQGYGMLDIAIIDGVPVAENDSNQITEDATPNTVTGSLKPNDNLGTDTANAGNEYTPIDNVSGAYGSFTVDAAGNYTYTLDNTNDTVNKLSDGKTLVDTITYTITDADGDTATAVLTITINGHTDGVPSVSVPVEPSKPESTIPATNPNVTPTNPETPNQPKDAGNPDVAGDDKTVFEGDDAVAGSFFVTTDPTASITSITIADQKLPVGANGITPTTIVTDKGTLTIQSYDLKTGEVKYTYDPIVLKHPSNEPLVDSFPITVEDSNNITASDKLDIAITDSLPAANDDKAEITEDAASNTVTGSLKVNDDFGVDGEAATNPFTPVENAKGQYGSFTIAADGTYTYVLNNEQKEVSDLNKGDTLVDTISYTITDGDGDTSTAILTVTINGNTDGVPNVTVPVDPTSPTTPITPTNPNVTPNNPETPNQPQNAGSPTANAGDKVVFEGDDRAKGDFTVTQDPNNPIITIKVGNVDIPVVGGTIAATPIPAEKGTMTVESYDPATGKVTYTYDPVPQNHPSNEPVTESFPITVTDKAGKTAVETLDIAITDSLPAANDDKAEITEDAASNTVTGSLKVNDDFGVDGEAATNPFTPVENAKGQYGSFTIAADGTYTYVLNNEQKEVSDLNKGDTLVDTISYTITDGDGDTSTAILTVTINGNTDGVPNVTVPVDPTSPTTPITPTNPNVTPNNPETPNQPQNAGSPTANAGDKVVFEGDDRLKATLP
nr:VCBS domain-containing protein [Alysiella crassa]UOP07065.1 VCBS domain-containing protein [Alysiella crassa]